MASPEPADLATFDALRRGYNLHDLEPTDDDLDLSPVATTGTEPDDHCPGCLAAAGRATVGAEHSCGVW